MKVAALQIPNTVRQRAMALGEAGVAWLASLDDLVRDLATEWQLTIEKILAGGTASFVAEARKAIYVMLLEAWAPSSSRSDHRVFSDPSGAAIRQYVVLGDARTPGPPAFAVDAVS